MVKVLSSAVKGLNENFNSGLRSAGMVAPVVLPVSVGATAKLSVMVILSVVRTRGTRSEVCSQISALLNRRQAYEVLN